jgi:hypothetical protein
MGPRAPHLLCEHVRLRRLLSDGRFRHSLAPDQATNMSPRVFVPPWATVTQPLSVTKRPGKISPKAYAGKSSRKRLGSTLTLGPIVVASEIFLR